MNQATRFASSFFAFLLLVHVPALAQNPLAQNAPRADRFNYSMPPGWQRVEKQGITVFSPPNLPPGKMAEIRIMPMRPLSGGSVEQNVRDEIEFIKGKYANVQPMPTSAVLHHNGFELGFGAASMETAPRSGQFGYATWFFARAGEQVQPVFFLTNDQQLYMNCRPTIDAFVHLMRFGEPTVLVKADPPLTRDAADALLDVLFFEACQVNSQPEVMPTPQMKEQWAKELTANYAKFDANARQQIAQMPAVNASIRSQWAMLPEEQKTVLRLRWSGVPEVNQIAVALINAQLPQAAPGAPNSASARGDKDKSAVEISKELDDQQAAYKALNNASMNLYQAQMSAISSVGSAGWRYEYR